MAVTESARQAAALRLVAVHGERVITASARMRDVISAAPERTAVPRIVEINPQRSMRTDGGLQTHRRLPRAIAHARDAFAVGAGGVQRHAIGR